MENAPIKEMPTTAENTENGGLMKGRNSQFERIIMLMNLLEGAPHGLTASALTDRLSQLGHDVTQRTVYRDLQGLHAAGLPLKERGRDDQQGQRWTLKSNARIANYLVLNSREILTLYLARSMLTPLKETPFFADLVSMFNKISATIGEQGQRYLDELSKDWVIAPGPSWGLGLKPEIIDTVRAATLEHQLLKVTYNSSNSGTVKERMLGPHFLYFSQGSLYLIAEDLGDGKLKTFALPRILSATMMDEPYTAPAVEPEKLFSSSFGIFRGGAPEKVRIAVNARIAAFIRERRWHPSQTVITRERGALELQIEVAVTPELVQWILGFGGNLEVLEPVSLRKRILAEAEAVVGVYGERPRRVG